MWCDFALHRQRIWWLQRPGRTAWREALWGKLKKTSPGSERFHAVCCSARAVSSQFPGWLGHLTGKTAWRARHRASSLNATLDNVHLSDCQCSISSVHCQESSVHCQDHSSSLEACWAARIAYRPSKYPRGLRTSAILIRYGSSKTPGETTWRSCSQRRSPRYDSEPWQVCSRENRNV
jgi:hypothetical protein